MTKGKIKVVAAPTATALTIEEIADQLRLPDGGAGEEELLSRAYGTAHRWFEKETNRTLTETTYELSFDAFQDGSPRECYRLERPPYIEVVSFQYTNDQGVDTDVDPSLYYVDDSDGEGFAYIRQVEGTSWPTDVAKKRGAIKIRYKAGYSPVPDDLKQTLLYVIGELYENRQISVFGNVHEMPFSADDLLWSYKLPEYPTA